MTSAASFSRDWPFFSGVSFVAGAMDHRPARLPRQPPAHCAADQDTRDPPVQHLHLRRCGLPSLSADCQQNLPLPSLACLLAAHVVAQTTLALAPMAERCGAAVPLPCGPLQSWQCGWPSISTPGLPRTGRPSHAKTTLTRPASSSPWLYPRGPSWSCASSSW